MPAVPGDRRAVELGQPAVPTLRRAPSYHACRASRILHRASPLGREHAGWLEISQPARTTNSRIYPKHCSVWSRRVGVHVPVAVSPRVFYFEHFTCGFGCVVVFQFIEVGGVY